MLGATYPNTSVPIATPRLVLAPDAVEEPVPPSATAKSVIPTIVPPVISTAVLFCVDKVPNESTAVLT